MAVDWRRWGRRRLLALFVAYLLIFAVSAVGGPFRIEPPVPIRPAFLGNLMLIVGGAAGALWLWLNAGRRGLLAAGLIAGLAYLIEGVGHTTSLPFGRYAYTGALAPVLPGGVPLAIVCAWLLVVVGALGVAGWLLPPGAGRSARVAAGAALVLGLDLQIETVAAHIQRFWTWTDGGPYYGVPTANFVAWLVAGLALCGLTLALTERADGGAPVCLTWLPAALYGLIVALFTLMNLAYGYGWPALIGAATLALMAGRAVRAARHPWPGRASAGAGGGR
jgi:putative membrane protein